MSEFGLSYDQQSNVIGRAPGKLLKGGLGALGVGQMWFDGDDTDPAYADVPYVEFTEGAMYAGQPPKPEPLTATTGPKRLYRVAWSRAPSAVAHHVSTVEAESEQDAIEILQAHLGFTIDCWLSEVDG